MKKVTAKSAMKKFVGISAMALMLGTGMNFVSCSSDDDDGGDEQQEVQVDGDNGQQSEDEKEKEEVDDTKTVSSITATESAEVYEGASEDDLRSKITVTAVYDDESTAAVTSYTISGFDGSKTGEQEVTVTYKEKTATVKVTVKAEVLFTSLTFDAAFDGTNDKLYQNEKTNYVSSDGTWTILAGVSKSVAKVSKAEAKSYNEDTAYTSRIQIKLETLKLKVGKNKSVILRVDGGSASGT